MKNLRGVILSVGLVIVLALSITPALGDEGLAPGGMGAVMVIVPGQSFSKTVTVNDVVPDDGYSVPIFVVGNGDLKIGLSKTDSEYQVLGFAAVGFDLVGTPIFLTDFQVTPGSTTQTVTITNGAAVWFYSGLIYTMQSPKNTTYKATFTF